VTRNTGPRGVPAEGFHPAPANNAGHGIKRVFDHTRSVVGARGASALARRAIRQCNGPSLVRSAGEFGGILGWVGGILGVGVVFGGSFCDLGSRIKS
jgi:hypothetical protein